MKKITDALATQYLWVALATTILQSALVFQPIGFLLSTVLLFVNVVLFVWLKEFVSVGWKKIGFFMFKLSIPLYLMNLISLLGKTLTNLSDRGGIMPILLMLHATVVILAFAFTMNKEKKVYIDNIYNANPWHVLKKPETGMKKGDVQLCINTDTEEPVILPFKDRFLHMLILGPTGSGKTSQILLPMINQDMAGSYIDHHGNEEPYGLTVIEPKGDLAEKVAAMGRHYGKEVVYFNPTHKDCPSFNPLYGPEAEVIENMATTFKMLDPDSPQFFKDMNETLIRNSLKVIKRLKGNSATFLDLSTLVFNVNNEGRTMINALAQLGKAGQAAEIKKENLEITDWFYSEYLNDRSKVYENCSGIRSQISKIISNPHLRRVLNPTNGTSDVDFAKVIEEGKILAISTAQGDLRELSRFLGYFIILNFQSAVFKRPGTENTRRPHFLYIDEFQTYSNPGFADMLTQGRSYRVASHLATQNRALMAMNGGRDGKNFVELVSTNARNLVIFPGGNGGDAVYYSKEFGDVLKKTESRSISKSKFNLFYVFQKMNYPNESIRYDEKESALFSHSDIIYNEFGKIIYRIVYNNSVQRPGKGTVSWLPREFSQKIDEMVDDYNREQLISPNPEPEVVEDDVLPEIRTYTPRVEKQRKTHISDPMEDEFPINEEDMYIDDDDSDDFTYPEGESNFDDSQIPDEAIIVESDDYDDLL